LESSELLISIALILLMSRITSQLATSFRLPSVFGVLMAGVFLGPSVTGLVEPTPVLEGLSAIGVVLLLFVAGVETDLVEMRRVGAAALLAAIGGVALPMAGGTALAIAFGYDTAEAVFVGTILTATSVTVSAHVLKELGRLQGRIGSAILGAAVIDDVIGVIVLTIVVSAEGDGSLFDLVRLVAFIPIALLAGHWLTKLTAVRVTLFESREHRFVEVLALVLAFAWAAQELGGLAAISGAYLVGVLFSRTLLREDLTDFGNLIGYTIFAPIFFVMTGAAVDLSAVSEAPVFIMLLSVVAIMAKVVGCYGGALAGRFSQREALAVGCGMVPRGEVALVITVLGHESGVIGDQAFAAGIAVTLVTTLVAPLLLRVSLPRDTTSPITVDRRTVLAAEMERIES